MHGAREGEGRKQEEMEEKHVHSFLTESFMCYYVLSVSLVLLKLKREQ